MPHCLRCDTVRPETTTVKITICLSVSCSHLATTCYCTLTQLWPGLAREHLLSKDPCKQRHRRQSEPCAILHYLRWYDAVGALSDQTLADLHPVRASGQQAIASHRFKGPLLQRRCQAPSLRLRRCNRRRWCPEASRNHPTSQGPCRRTGHLTRTRNGACG